MPVARGLLEDQLRKSVPGDDVAAAIVIGAPGGEAGLARPRPRFAEWRRQDRLQGWASSLVIDDLKFRALGAEAQNGAHEVGAVSAGDRRRAQDHMARAGLAHQALAFLLAAPVDAERRDRVVLAIGALLFAVEHIIGGNLDKGHAACGRSPGEQRGAVTIGTSRRVRLVLGLVDGGIARGIDDGRRRSLATARSTAAWSEMSTAACWKPTAASPARRRISRPTCPFAPNTKILRCMSAVSAGSGLAEGLGLARQADALGFVASIENGLPPSAILKIPAHRLGKAGLERLLRAPAKLALDLGGIDGIAPVVARPVGDERDQSPRGPPRAGA